VVQLQYVHNCYVPAPGSNKIKGIESKEKNRLSTANKQTIKKKKQYEGSAPDVHRYRIGILFGCTA